MEPEIDADLLGRLRQELTAARELGLVGPGDIDDHLQHGIAFSRAVLFARRQRQVGSAGTQGVAATGSSGTPGPGGQGDVLDLGSGGGLPGLVIACWLQDVRLVLLDAAERRTRFLDGAVAGLGLTDRVQVAHERAEIVGREVAFRGRFDAVVARSFGPPPVTAECAAPFLKVGGSLVVSEPPAPQEASERWPATGLALLGMGEPRPYSDTYRFVVIPQLEPCPERFPRRVGVPAKRALF